jgi:hypothetical protein
MKSMSRTGRIPAVLAAALTVLATSAGAQGPAAAPTPAIEPAAMAALQGMGAYLRGIKTFQVDAVTTDEVVLDDGQKLLSDGSVRVLAQMPTRLMAQVSNDRHDRLYLYDGKTFTLFAKRLNYYATMQAPPTIGELADKLDKDYDFTVPLEDLFRWGGPHWTPEGITGAMVVGPSDVLDTTCEQYAFRQADIDWQIWIQKGDHPLPRKLVITTKTDEARPQYTAVYAWNLAPSFNADSFVFNPPAGTGKVVLAESKPSTGANR